MTINLDEIEKALKDGTPTPWSEKAIFWLLRHGRKDSGGWDDEIKDDEFMPDEDDAHLIANAPEWLRLLVERVSVTNKVVLAAVSERDNHHHECKCYFCEAVDAYKKECL